MISIIIEVDEMYTSRWAYFVAVFMLLSYLFFKEKKRFSLELPSNEFSSPLLCGLEKI